MRSRRLGRGVRLAVAVGTALAFACSCTSGTTQTSGSGAPSNGTVFGPSQPLGNGTVKTSVTLDGAGQTAFNHVMLNWNPQGHETAELFGKPHFDFHFDMVDMTTMQAINPDDPKFAAKAEHLPEPRFVPQDYVVPPNPPVMAQVVPGMGVHLVDSSDATLVPGK